MAAVASEEPSRRTARPYPLTPSDVVTPVGTPEMMVPSPVRPRFSQTDLDRLSQNADDVDSKNEKIGGLARSDSLGDMQLLTIKRDKEFPNEEAILQVQERRKETCKIQLGLTQEQLDKLCWTSDSEPEGERSPGDSGANAVHDIGRKLLHVKRERAFGERPDTVVGAGLPQDQLDLICKDGTPGVTAESGASKCPSGVVEEARAREEGELVEEKDSAYVKKRKERTYLEKPLVAPSSRLSLGFSQSQLDYIVGYDEADQSNIPEPQSSPHGSALTAIKRGKTYKQGSLPAEASVSPESMLGPAMPQPKRGTNQAELDALCVEAEDDDDQEEEGVMSAKGSLVSKLEREGLEDEGQEWQPWNSPVSPTFNISSPRSQRGGRSPSPGHGGA